MTETRRIVRNMLFDNIRALAGNPYAKLSDKEIVRQATKLRRELTLIIANHT